jgi:hypothetical protein
MSVTVRHTTSGAAVNVCSSDARCDSGSRDPMNATIATSTPNTISAMTIHLMVSPSQHLQRCRDRP